MGVRELHERKVDEFRTLSGGCCSAKLVASAVAVPLSELAGEVCDEAQHGILQGDNRKIQKAILKSEQNAVYFAHTDDPPLWLSADIKAAFPSVSLGWLWKTLESLGVPYFVIKAVKILYGNGQHIMVWNGKCFGFT